MQPLIENLVELQRLNTGLAELAARARALPAEIAQAEATLKAADKQAGDATAALEHEEALRAKLETEGTRHKQKVARLKDQQDSVTTPAQAAAMEHEVEFGQAEIDRIENEEFASLERTEAAEIHLRAAREAAAEAAEALAKTRTRVAERQHEIAGEQTRLEADRKELRTAVEPDWLARFDRIASSRGTGIARADDRQCTGCRMGVRPQVWNQLREGELLNCDSCGRLLYWDPAMAPPPAKGPQIDSAGSGHAIRKPRNAGA